MEKMLQLLEERFQNGINTVLAVIIEERGSVPRSAGAYMAVGDEGLLAGSIGGGDLEYRGILAAQEMLKKAGQQDNRISNSQIWEYDMKQWVEDADPGMVCGGHVKVLFYRIDAKEKRNQSIFFDIHALIDGSESFWILFPLQGGFIKPVKSLDTDLHQLIVEIEGTSYYAEQFAYDGMVYIFGGGHLAKELTPLLSHLGFSCIVMDDREEYANEEIFPTAKKACRIDFANPPGWLKPGKEDYIVIATREHLSDADAQRFALRSEAGYIGVMGSRRKAKYIYELLLSEGISKEQLDRVTTPIGISIGSETAAEIAISIAAQLIQVRANKKHSGHSKTAKDAILLKSLDK